METVVTQVPVGLLTPMSLHLVCVYLFARNQITGSTLHGYPESMHQQMLYNSDAAVLYDWILQHTDLSDTFCPYNRRYPMPLSRARAWERKLTQGDPTNSNQHLTNQGAFLLEALDKWLL